MARKSYKGKSVKIDFVDSNQKKYPVTGRVRNEFQYDKFIILRVGFTDNSNSILMDINPYDTVKGRTLTVSDFNIDGEKFKDSDFNWLDFESKSLVAFVDESIKFKSGFIDILFKENIDGTLNIISVAMDSISKVYMHQILLNM